MKPLIIILLLMANVFWMALGFPVAMFAMLWIGYSIGIIFASAPVDFDLRTFKQRLFRG